MFALVVGALAAVAVAIVVLTIAMPDLSLRMFAADTEDHRVAVEDRISPIEPGLSARGRAWGSRNR